MRMGKYIKYVAIISLFIVVGSAFSTMAYGKKPEGSPCYVLGDDMDVGPYAGDVSLQIINKTLMMRSGNMTYETDDLVSFNEESSQMEEMGDSYVKYENHTVFVLGEVNKEFQNYRYFYYEKPYAVVSEDSGIWVYNVVNGTYQKYNLVANKSFIAGNYLFYQIGEKIYRTPLNYFSPQLYREGVDDFYLIYDPAGYQHYVYEKNGVIKYGNDVPNVYGLLNSLNIDNKTREKWKFYLDYDLYDDLISEINNMSVENGRDSWLLNLFKDRVYYTKIDPTLPDTSVHTAQSIMFTFPAYGFSGDFYLTFKAYGFGEDTVVYTTREWDPEEGVFRLVQHTAIGHVHLYVYINGHKVLDMTGESNTWYTKTVKLPSNYIGRSRSTLNGILFRFELVSSVKTVADTGKVEFITLKNNNLYVFSDGDNDGLGLAWEKYYGTDPTKPSTDGDSLSDGLEINGWNINVNGHTVKVTSNPLKKDTDGDGLNDGEEYNYHTSPRSKDTDGDGMPDKWEIQYGLNPNKNDDKNEDKDGDGLSNYQEYENGTNPNKVDTDGDGMPDGWEIHYGLNPKNSGDKMEDKDGDNLLNYEEYQYGTDPTKNDTDRDGLSDYMEVKQGWTAYWYDSSGNYHTKHVFPNPLVADTDGDGLSDKEEYHMKLNPRSNDTDGDGLKDSNEYYTKVYEYPKRMYVDGEEFTIYMKWREEQYSVGVKDAKLLIGIRGKGSSKIWVDVMYGTTYLKDISNTSVEYESVSLLNYVGKSDRYVKLKIGGNGWLETAKVILVEESDAHRWDTDGDGLSDGYEVNGKSGYITSPVNRDTDGDGIRDDWEIRGWSWNYDAKTRYRNNNGFHTNPLSKDTDGDGCPDNEDANPLANLVLRMSLEKYTYDDHPSYTKFAGFWAKWELNGDENSVKYYTKHKDNTNNLHGYVYWLDIPDDIHTKIDVRAAAFYNDAGDKKLGEDSGSFNIKNNYKYWISKGSSNPTYQFMAKFWVYPLHRINTVAVYNESSFMNGRFSYSGKFYILYVDSTSSQGAIKSGLNVLVIPDALFVNSQLYKKIKNNDVSYLVGSDSTKAKMGAITTKSNGVHIVGMFFFKTNANNLIQLLSLMSRNATNVQFSHYKAITPETANLPDDVLQAIPFHSIKNSGTGGPPQNLWQQVTSQITNAVISVADFIYNGLVALGNLIEKAATIVGEFYMKLWNTAVSAVKAAVEVVKKVVDAMVQGLINTLRNMFSGIIKEIQNAVHNWFVGIVDVVKEIEVAKSNEEAMVLGLELFKATFGGILPYVMGLTIAIEAGIMILQGVTGGLATLIISMVAMIIVNAFLGDVGIPGNKHMNTDYTFSGLAKNIVNDVYGDNSNENEGRDRITISVVMSGIATVLSLTGFLISWGLNAIEVKYTGYSEKTVRELVGEGASISAIFLGFMGLILSTALASNDLVIPNDTKNILNVWSGVIGSIGFIFSIVGMALNPSSLGMGGILLDTMALAFSLVSLFVNGVI